VANGDQTIVIVGMVIALSVLLLFELRFMRGRRRRREAKANLPDQAHNALLTTKAIGAALARGGVRSPQAEELIGEADAAYRERNYRVALELADRAKEVLRIAKLRQQKRGDVAKLEEIATKQAASTDVTEKERLMKELPPNYMQSKFSMGLAGDDIAAAKARGQSTAEAERFLSDAQTSFDGQDYEMALKHAVRARRALESPAPGAAPAVPPAAPAPTAANARACASCGAPVAADDTFCRKCGVAVPKPRTCASCRAPVADDDAFCRKCGTAVPSG